MTDTGTTATQLFFQQFGDASNPPLFLVHGLFGDSSTMAPLAARFADCFRVIAIDAIGHGKSPRPEGFTLVDQGLALDSLIAELGYDSAAVLGVSMGSYVAAQAAILEPSRVSRLVLVVTKGQGKTSSTAAFAERNGFDISAATLEETMAFMASALWSPDTSQQRRDELLAIQSGDAPVLTPEERAAIERSLAGFDLRPDLQKITARTLVISGLSDGLNPPEAGKEVADLIPGARFDVYQHSGHMLAYEEMDRLVDDVTTLLTE